jgi:hypothetical protein
MTSNNNDKDCGVHTTCHCEEGVSPTWQSLPTGQEIASPLRGFAPNSNNNDKDWGYTRPVIRGGVSPTWQSIHMIQSRGKIYQQLFLGNAKFKKPL